jgi:hypothetical protein
MCSTAELHVEGQPAEARTTGGGRSVGSGYTTRLLAFSERILARSSRSRRPGNSGRPSSLDLPRRPSLLRASDCAGRSVPDLVSMAGVAWRSAPPATLPEHGFPGPKPGPASSGRHPRAHLPRYAPALRPKPRHRVGQTLLDGPCKGRAGGRRRHTPLTPVARRDPIHDPPDGVGLRGIGPRAGRSV